MARTIFESDHEHFRSAVRTFAEKEITPHIDEWEQAGILPRDVWLAAGEQGFLGFAIPEEYGGGGARDFRFNAVVDEEMIKSGCDGVGFPLHNDVLAPYLLDLTNDEQKQRWLPGFASGELISAVAMTEPGTGSDLAAIKTTAKRDGDSYVVNGQKTFISNGILADIVVVAVKTDPEAGYNGISLVVVERGMEGFERGRNLKKVGLKSQDTAEMYFDNVRVPVENLIGTEGQGFIHLMEKLPQERLSIAVMAAAVIEESFKMTLEYAKERKAFGKPIGSFQHNRFVLAEIATEAQVCRTYVDDAIMKLNRGELTIVDAAMAKWWTTELQKKVVDQCLQMFGGHGYMWEMPIARAWAATRIQTIYGGTTEIMKEIIGRNLGV